MTQPYAQHPAIPASPKPVQKANPRSFNNARRVNMILHLAQLAINAPQHCDQSILRTFSDRLLPATRKNWNL